MAKDKNPKNEAVDTPEQPEEPKVFDNTGFTVGDLMNINYTNEKEARADLEEFANALRKKTSVQLRKSSGHDLSVIGRDGKQVIKICPLKLRYSASLPGDNGKIGHHTKKEILEAIKSLE